MTETSVSSKAGKAGEVGEAGASKVGMAKANMSSAKAAASKTGMPTYDVPSSRIGATLALDEPITRISGVSKARVGMFAKLGVRTVRDLLTHFPRRYMDLTHVATAADAQIGVNCTIFGEIHEVKLKRPRRNLPIVEIALTDKTGVIIISVFHQPWLKDKLHPGDAVMAAGRIEFSYGFKRMTNPFLEVVQKDNMGARIIPVHSATGKLTPPIVRAIVDKALKSTEGMLDPLPLSLRRSRRLASRGSALRAMHFPSEMGELKDARRRLAYEELLFLQIYMMQESQTRAQHEHPVQHVVDGPKCRALEAALPFTLTGEQENAKRALLASMAAPSVANHMVLGDVGTGKTIIAAFGMAAAADSGGQGVLLAPTEVLATQHESTLGPLFDAAGITHALLTGSTRKSDRAAILEAFRKGELDVLIGTHAILEDDVCAKKLTFAVIDEQQRFGVNQRAKLLEKGHAIDALYLTATPIPRSLALTLFGSLTLSYIHEKPHAMSERSTCVLPASKRGVAYDAANDALKRGEQVYVVCPLIGVSADERDDAASTSGKREEADESYHPVVAIEDDRDFAFDNLAAAESHAVFLREKVFPGFEVGLLHGGMPAEEKALAMKRFASGETNVLVATTVIEVGVDVPNATVMIVEDADRFGLSQLHQLRGRVGRGCLDAQVFFVSASQKELALKRLSVLEASDDGFEIASYDLSLRREGDILGNRQSGASSLKLVNIVRDSELIEEAHADAQTILEKDPALELPEHAPLAREVRMLFKGEHATVGG